MAKVHQMHVRIMNDEATSGTSSLTHFPEPFLALGFLILVGSAKDVGPFERAICDYEVGEARDRQSDGRDDDLGAWRIYPGSAL
jgi:hypothetical protein